MKTQQCKARSPYDGLPWKTTKSSLASLPLQVCLDSLPCLHCGLSRLLSIPDEWPSMSCSLHIVGVRWTCSVKAQVLQKPCSRENRLSATRKARKRMVSLKPLKISSKKQYACTTSIRCIVAEARSSCYKTLVGKSPPVFCLRKVVCSV